MALQAMMKTMVVEYGAEDTSSESLVVPCSCCSCRCFCMAVETVSSFIGSGENDTEITSLSAVCEGLAFKYRNSTTNIQC